MDAFQHSRGVWFMAIFSTTHKTRIKPPSDATMTNLLLININAKSNDCTYGRQGVLDLYYSYRGTPQMCRCVTTARRPHSTEQVPSLTRH